MAQSRFYSANAQPTVLTASITPTDVIVQVQQTVGFPANTPYILALDYNASSEEIVLVTAAAGTNLTVTRGYDGTSATSHGAGASVRHTWTAADGNDSRAHEGSTAGVHGVTGNVVGTTDSQTLTNKTLASATLNTPTINSPSFSGTVNLASPNITGIVTGGASYTAPTITNPSITGTVSGAATYLEPTAQASADGNPSFITKRRSATQTGALASFRDETGTQLSFVSFDGVARWRAGMSGGSADQMHVTSAGNIDTTGTLTIGSTGEFTIDSSGNVNSSGSFATTGRGGWTSAFRQTDSAGITSSTTLTNDSVLFIPTLAGASYELDCCIIFNAAPGQDIKVAWTFPSGATMMYAALGTGPTNFTDYDASMVSGSVARPARGNNSVPQTVNARGYLINAGSGGNLQLQWAQNTSGATATTVLKGSWIRLHRVA